MNSFAASASEWPGLRKQIRQTLHVPEQLPALREKAYLPFNPEADVQADRVIYSTDYDLRVPAIVYHPAGATLVKHPALVIVDGHDGDKSSVYSYWAGVLYARAGAVVLTYDPIGEFERNRERRSAMRQHDEVVKPDDMALRMTGFMVTDVLQAVHYLQSRKDVDEKRIAVLGFSMGSFISSLACAVTTDVHACVLVGGGDLDGPGGYWDNSLPMCQSTAYKALSYLGDRGAAIFALNAKRGPTLIWNGTKDDIVDIDRLGRPFFEAMRRNAIARLGSSKDVFDFGFTPDGGHRPYFISRPVALWLNEKLKFPNWTKKQIESMPETHLSEWALKNHLQQASQPGYERFEGGLMALGENIPAILRSQLHAVPDAVWSADQDDYIYESWLARAQAAEEATK